jgi:hypothetical protein
MRELEDGKFVDMKRKGWKEMEIRNSMVKNGQDTIFYEEIETQTETVKNKVMLW